MNRGGPSGVRNPREVFDGKQLRKAVQRRTVDFSASASRWLLYRTWQDGSATDAPTIQPTTECAPELLPPSAASFRANPTTTVCTRFVHSSVNKPRVMINAVRWSPDGKRLITGTSGGEFTLWNGLTFNFETILQAHDAAVRALLWSHNQDWLITADNSGVVKYWQENMNNLKAFCAHDESIRDLTFSPTDLKFASCSDDGSVKVWDFERVTEERKMVGHGWDVRSVDWHPWFPILASGSKDSLVKIWDAKSGRALTTLHGHKNTIVKVKWNRNGNWLLSGARDQLIKAFDIRMMKEFATFRGHRREVTSLEWHPEVDDAFASGAYDGGLYYWSMKSPEPLASIPHAHASAVWDIDWHPVGHMLVSGSNDQTTKFWTRNRPGDARNNLAADDDDGGSRHGGGGGRGIGGGVGGGGGGGGSSVGGGGGGHDRSKSRFAPY